MRKAILLILTFLSLSLSAFAQQAQFDVRRYGARCDGSTNDATAFAAANTAAAVNGGDILVPRNCAIATNTTFASNVNLEFSVSGRLTIANGITVTVNGNIVAGPRQRIFALNGTGQVRLVRMGEVWVDWFGATGDGQTDSTGAIQAAVNSLNENDRTVRFSTGTYVVSSTINTPQTLMFRGEGARYASGSRLIGNIAGYLISFTPPGVSPGGGLENLNLHNTNAAGGGITYTNVNAPFAIRDCFIEAYRGITSGENAFSVLVENVRLATNFNPSGSWGLFAYGHHNCINLDVAGYDHGIRFGGGTGYFILGGRFEVNNTAIHLGRNSSNDPSSATGVFISGVSFEANNTAINVEYSGGFSIGNFYIQGTSNAPAGQSLYGVLSSSLSAGTFQDILISGGFTVAGIQARSGVFRNVTTVNTLGATWRLLDPDACTFIDTNYDPLNNGVTAPNVVRKTQFVRSLAGLDHLISPAQGRNLRSVGVAVPNEASFVDVVFPYHTVGNAAIFTATTTSNISSTLPAGTYYYIATIVNSSGETAATSEKVVTVTSGQQVDLTFYGNTGQFKRRIYRGTASGVYTVYFETALSSNAPFSDSGQAATGFGIPPTSGTLNADGREPDTNYGVVVSPAWNTTTWISNKTTTGFRINFGTPSVGSTSLDWLLFR